MHAFEYCNPTKVIFGAGRASEIGKIVSEYGKKVLFITYDKETVDKIGLLSKILIPMQDAELEICECYGVKSNPSLKHARELVKKAAEFNPDVIVAMGGGSVIDEAKAVGASLRSEEDIWDMVEDNSRIKATVPVITVCTIPATSSEMNNIAVISNDETGRKDGLESPVLYPVASLLDPELTRTIPLRQTAYSAADITSHLLEGYLSHTDAFVPMQNRYFAGMIKTQMDCMERLLENPQDLDARAMMMWAATYSWNGFCVLGIGPFESMIHACGHIISEMYDTAHGATMAIIIPSLMRLTLEKRKARYAMIAREVFGVDEEDEYQAAKLAIRHMKEWLDHIGAPTSLAAAGIPLDRFDEMVERAYKNVVYYGHGDAYTEDDIRKLFEYAKE